jgi:hypothetical protein
VSNMARLWICVLLLLAFCCPARSRVVGALRRRESKNAKRQRRDRLAKPFSDSLCVRISSVFLRTHSQSLKRSQFTILPGSTKTGAQS